MIIRWHAEAHSFGHDGEEENEEDERFCGRDKLEEGEKGVGNDRGRRRERNSGCTWTICTVDLASRRATPTHTSLRAHHGMCGSPRTYTRATCERESVYALGSACYSHSLARAGR